MKEKLIYDAPVAETVELNAESRILDGSVGTVGVNDVNGWNSGEEAW